MRRFIIFLVAVYCSAVLKAQSDIYPEPGDTLTAGPLSEVVISAARFGTIGINTPEAIRILDTKSVNKAQLRTTPEAMALTPGVFVQKTNHGGGSPFVRGLTGNQTLLLIDGIRLNNSTMRYGPNQYFNTIDIFSLDRIEVLRGSGSVQYGSDALGGTIQAFSSAIETSEKPYVGARVLGRLATHDMEKTLHAAIKYSSNAIALRAGITRRDFGDIIGGDTTRRQTPSGYNEFDYDLKGTAALSLKSTVTFLYQDVGQKNVPVYHKILLENYAVNTTDPQKRKLAYIRLNQDFDAGILKSAAFTASFQNTREGRESRKNGSDISRFEYDKVRTLGFSGEAIAGNNNNWSGNLGFEIYSDIVNSSRTDTDINTGIYTDKRGLYPDGSAMTSLALFSVHSLDLNRWNITFGGRVNSFVINVSDGELGDVKLTPSALVGNLGLMRKINSGSNLFISLSTGFRAPNIDDLGTLGIVDFRYETPNFDLKPESSFQYQLGYKYLGDRLKGDIFLYRNELYDLITRIRMENQVIEGYPVYQKENSERAYIQGVETAWILTANRFLNLSGTLTYAYGQNITKDEPMRRIPPLFGRMALNYSVNNLSFDLEWIAAAKQDRLAQGDIDDNRIPEGGTPGWSVFNINSGYSWKYFAIGLSLKNLFNQDYRYHGSGVNGYGRSVFVTFEVNI